MNQQHGPPSSSAGWYPDPHVPYQYRYWSGAAWTEHVARAAPDLIRRGWRRGLSTNQVITWCVVAAIAVVVLLGVAIHDVQVVACNRHNQAVQARIDKGASFLDPNNYPYSCASFWP